MGSLLTTMERIFNRNELASDDDGDEHAARGGLQNDLDFLDRCCAGMDAPIVLVATGSFCPPHRGHLEMMQAAKNALGPGSVPVGAIMVPSSDDYLECKGVPLIPFELRSEMLQAMASDMSIGPWIHVSDAEHRRGEFYLEVLTRLSAAAERGHSRLAPRLVFVTGSDRPRPLSQKRDGMAGVVVVPRAGNHRPDVPPRFLGDLLRCVAAPLAGSASALSSTQLREGVQDALAVAERDGVSPQVAVEAAITESMSPSAAKVYASAMLDGEQNGKRRRQ